MIQALLRHGLGVAVLLGLLTVAVAQEAKDKPAKGKDAAAKDAPPPPPADPFDSYRELFKKPETVADYWKAIEFEIEVGSFEVAAQNLRGLLAKKPTEEQLLELQRQVTMNAFLRLRNIPKWSKDAAADKAARADVEELIKQVTAAVKNQLSNRDQIREWVKNLNATHEEAVYALQELYKYKAAAAPVLIEELKKTQGGDRVALIDALRRLSSAVVPPMIAALDSSDNMLVLDLLDILQKRGATEAVPFLWYLTEAPDRPPSVQKKAKAVIAALRDVPASRLPAAEPMLVQEAERFFQHKVPLAEPATVWRWEGNTVVPGWPGVETVSKSKTEEYYALRFAKQALELDPTDRAAQIVMLSTTLDKTYESVPLDKPLAVTAPAVNDLLTRVNPELLTAVLERAIKDEHTTIVLGAVRALGDLAEARANKPSERGAAPLAQALFYPDRRVQMAAVDSLLRVPGTPSALARGRMVEILARFLAAEPEAGSKPKALAASADTDGRLRLDRALQDAGFEPVLVTDGRAALKRLDGAADISAILLDSKLPDPGLPYFIAQVESDPNLKKLPMLILAVPDTVEARDLLDRYGKEQARLDYLISKSQQLRHDRLAAQSKYMASRKAYLDNPVSNIQEQSDRLAILDDNYQASLRDLARQLPHEAIFDKEAQGIERTLKELALRYDGETSRREAALKRWAEPYANIQIVTQKYLDDIRQLRSRLLGGNKAESKPLSEAEQREYAEKSVRLLGQMAKAPAKNGYDIRSAEKPIFGALRAGTISAEGQIVAISTIGTLYGAEPQTELATVIIDPKRPLPVRIAATDELIRHIQEHNPLLAFGEIKALRSVADESTTQADLKDLRPHLSALMGSLRPDENATGERLRAFPLPSPVPTAKPADKPADEKPPAEKPPAEKPMPDKAP
jgi:CheY-like chemotaxis protein